MARERRPGCSWFVRHVRQRMKAPWWWLRHYRFGACLSVSTSPEDGGNMFLRKSVIYLQVYMAFKPRRLSKPLQICLQKYVDIDTVQLWAGNA